MRAVTCLTGANGFLGRSLASTLSQYFLVRAINRRAVDVPGVSECCVGDFHDQHYLEKSLRGCSLVVHAAAVTNPLDPAIGDVNVTFTESLVRAARKNNVKHFVYISTENVTYNCSDPYSASKSAAERIVLQAYPSALILRPSLLFGKNDTRYLSLFLRLIKSSYIVPIFPSSSCSLQPLHVEDAAQLITRAIRRRMHGIYTLVGSGPVTYRQLGKLIAINQGLTRIFVPVPSSLLKILSFLLRFGPRPARRLHYLLGNAFILRNTDKRALEKAFDYTLPDLASRLQDLNM